MPKIPTHWPMQKQQQFRRIQAEINRLGPLLLHPDTVKRKLSKDEIATIAWNATTLG